MQKNYIIIIALHLVFFMKGQQPLYSWAHSFGNSFTQRNSVDYTKRIYVDNIGDVYMSGSFIGLIDFDPSVSTYTLQSAGSRDIFLTKYSASGSFLWAKQIMGLNQEECLAITADASSNIYITGFFTGTTDFDPGPGVFNLTSGGTSMYFAKYDAAGNFIYAKLISGNGGIYPQSILLDASNNIYISGYVTGGYDFDPGPSTASGGGAAGSTASFICKYDNGGNYIFNDNFFPTGTALREFVIYNMDLDASKNIYVTGAFSGTIDLDPKTGTISVNSGSGAYKEDAFLAKYDSTGSYIWGKTFPCDGLAFSVSTDPSGNVLFTGYYNASFDLDTGPSVFSVPTGTNSCFVGKYSGTGNFILGFNIPGINMAPSFNGLKTNTGGDFYIVGGFSGTNIDFDPGPGTSTLSSTCQEMFISKYNSSGNFIWCNKIGCGMFNGLWSHVGALFLRNSSLYISGVFTGNNVDFDPGPGTTSLSTVSGTCNILLAKYNDCSTTVPSSPGSITGANQICQGSSAIYSVNTVSNATSYNWSVPGTWSGSSSTNTISITAGSTSGTISVSSVNSCGTSTASILSITVNPLPTINISGSSSVCTGNSLTLSASGANTYTWNTSATTTSIAVSPTINSTYSVTGTATNGCKNTAVKTISVMSLPILNITGNFTLCSGNSATLTASGATTYTWNTSSTSNSIIITPSLNTTYTLNGTGSNGCSNFTIKSVTVNPVPLISITGGSICAGDSFTLTATGANTYTYSGGSSIVSPTTTTSYSVTGTSSLGCVNTIPSTATVNVSNPITVSILGPNNVCTGQSINLVGNGATSYSWSNGATTASVVLTPSITTTFSIVGSAGSCSSTATKSITVNPIPVVSISGSTIMCTGETATLVANGALSYTWNTTTSGNSIIISPTITTNYTVIGTDLNNCNNSASTTMSVSACIGINEISGDNISMLVYPNPVSNILTISVAHPRGEKIKIMNILGEQISESTIETEKAYLNFNGYPNGIYFLRYGSITKKIIKH